ncbi:probable glucan endo-1,3-beta-glucosidase A6, partial [Tanacetum coccineum]
RYIGAHGAIGEWKNYSPKFDGRSSDWCANQGGSITYNDQPYPKFLKSSGQNLHELTELLDQKLDSEFICVAKYGYCDVMIAITETGWPLDGDLTQHGANRENAAVTPFHLPNTRGRSSGSNPKPFTISKTPKGRGGIVGHGREIDE